MGLSVIVHLVVIWTHRIFSYVPIKEPSKPVTTSSKRFLGSLIIIAVFSFVLATAFILIRASLYDSHSSIKLVDNYINYLDREKITLNVSVIKPLASPISTKVQQKKVLADNSCTQQFNNLSGIYNGSLINYLKANSYDFSYPARLK